MLVWLHVLNTSPITIITSRRSRTRLCILINPPVQNRCCRARSRSWYLVVRPSPFRKEGTPGLVSRRRRRWRRCRRPRSRSWSRCHPRGTRECSRGRCRRCRRVRRDNGDVKLHAHLAVVAHGADEPPPPGLSQVDLVGAGAPGGGAVAVAARLKVRPAHFHHVMQGLVVIEHCKATHVLNQLLQFVLKRDFN